MAGVVKLVALPSVLMTWCCDLVPMGGVIVLLRLRNSVLMLSVCVPVTKWLDDLGMVRMACWMWVGCAARDTV